MPAPSATSSFVPVTFSKTENLNLVGQTEDGDGFEETDSGANATFEIPPGSNPYSGSVTGFLAAGQAGHPPFSFVPITYAGFQGFGILPSSPATGTDTVLVDGTSGDDTFLYSQQTVGGISGPAVQLSTASLIPQATLFVGAAASVKFRGLGGNDTYNFDLTTPLMNVAAGTTVTVQGNGPGTNSVINYTHQAGGENGQIDFGLSQITDTTAGTVIPIVKFSGISAINDAGHGVAGDNLTILGTGNDNLTYSPINEGGLISESGIVTSSAAATPAINFASIAGTFTLGKTKQALVNGTTDSDDFVVSEGLTSTVTITTNGTILEPVTIASTVSSLALAGLSGDDTFVVNPSLAGGGLPLSIDGGDPNASDTLVVNASLAADFVVVNKGRILDTGVVRVYQNAVAMPDIAYKNVEIVSPNVATGADGQPQLLDMGPDLYEPNESIANAAFLGSGSTLQIQNASIYPNSNSNPPVPADQDYYRVVAQQTGTLDFQVYFKNFSTALLPGGGQLEAQVVDGQGNILGDAAVTTEFGSGLPATGNVRVRIPSSPGRRTISTYSAPPPREQVRSSTPTTPRSSTRRRRRRTTWNCRVIAGRETCRPTRRRTIQGVRNSTT